MPESKKAALRCPKCHKPIRPDFPAVIDAQRQPRLREKLMDSTLFRVHCPHCGAPCAVLARCLYYDRAKKFMVLLLPGFAEAQWSDARQAHDYPEMAQITKRIVGTARRMKEKILLLEAGANDRAIELAKLAAAEIASRRMGQPIAEAYVESLDEARNEIGFVFFPQGSGEPLHCTTSNDIYAFTRQITLPPAPAEAFLNVDGAWAADALAQYRRKKRKSEWTGEDE